MKKFLTAAAMAATAITGFSVATPAMAQDYGRYGYYDQGYNGGGYYDRYSRPVYREDYRPRGHRYHRNYRRCSGTTGAVIGGVVGALLGGEIGRGRYGGRSGTGTIVGAGAGALLGREVGRSDCRR